MKSVFAILFSLLLIATQTAFMAGGADSTPPKSSVGDCCCSHCQKHCCFRNDVPAPQSSPAMPTGSASQNNWQFLLAIVPHLLNQSNTEFSQFVPSDYPAFSLSTVPLYERDCSYRI
jgi:hypothetical protein